MSTPTNPTPWTSSQSWYHGYSRQNVIPADRCAVLERHLRRIVEAAKFSVLNPELYDAVQAAREELQ